MNDANLRFKRASDAWDKVHCIEGEKSEDWKDKYASYVESLPATILSCELGQAAASLLSAAAKNENSGHDLIWFYIKI